MAFQQTIESSPCDECGEGGAVNFSQLVSLSHSALKFV